MSLQQIAYSQTAEGKDRLDPTLIQGASLGVIRSSHVESKFDAFPLLAYCADKPNDLFNPNESTGSSPALRALIVQSGYAHSIVDEISSDGQTFGHEGGNAIDIGGGSQARALSDLRALTAFLHSIPALFSVVVYQDALDPTRSLYIWDGAIVSSSAGLTGMASTASLFALECRNKIHIASSKGRMAHAFRTNTALLAKFVPPAKNVFGWDRQVNQIGQDYSVAAYQSGQKTNTRW